jgi:HAD superfamily hydrolase (TIGR01509 family)
MTYEAIIFDLDGVLVDSEGIGFETLQGLLRTYGVDYRVEDNEPFIGINDRDHFTALKARHGLRPSVDELIAEQTSRLLAQVETRTIAMPGVPRVPERLRAAGYPLAVASSSLPDVIEARLEALGVRRLFGVVVSSFHVPRGKPAPDVFLEAARRLSVRADACLVVEDSVHGLRAAKAAGMRCAVVPTAGRWPDGGVSADVRLASLLDLEPLLLDQSHGGPSHGPPKPPDARSAPAQPGRSSKDSDRLS